ncbi:MAG TPA: hypothetical protein ACFCUC_18675 [Desulfobacterales bacterium]
MIRIQPADHQWNVGFKSQTEKLPMLQTSISDVTMECQYQNIDKAFSLGILAGGFRFSGRSHVETKNRARAPMPLPGSEKIGFMVMQIQEGELTSILNRSPDWVKKVRYREMIYRIL